jgi:hypothetical protein
MTVLVVLTRYTPLNSVQKPRKGGCDVVWPESLEGFWPLHGADGMAHFPFPTPA